MNEPLVCEDTDLDRLLETIRTEHGDAADILYQDSVRRGGMMGFFAQEVHRVVYRVADPANASGPDEDAAEELHPFAAIFQQSAVSLIVHRCDDVLHAFDRRERQSSVNVPSNLVEDRQECIDRDESYSGLDKSACQ